VPVLSADKTGVISFGSRSNITKLDIVNISVQVGYWTIQPSAVVRDLGLRAVVDETVRRQSSPQWQQFASAILHRLRQIRQRVWAAVTT